MARQAARTTDEGWTLGDRLATARRLARMEQADVAERLGVTPKTVSRWETNTTTPDFDHVVRFARITRQPLTWFEDVIDLRGGDLSSCNGEHPGQQRFEFHDIGDPDALVCPDDASTLLLAGAA